MAPYYDKDDHDMLIRMKESLEGFIRRVDSYLEKNEKDLDRRFSEIRTTMNNMCSELDALAKRVSSIEHDMIRREKADEAFEKDFVSIKERINSNKTSLESKIDEYKQWNWKNILIWVTLSGMVVTVVSFAMNSIM